MQVTLVKVQGMSSKGLGPVVSFFIKLLQRMSSSDALKKWDTEINLCVRFGLSVVVQHKFVASPFVCDF